MNRKLGNAFEKEFADRLFADGFWVLKVPQTEAGQPADIIAVRNGKAYLIDCKVCSNGVFPVSRIEPNQELAMDLWSKCNNGTGWFALKFDDRIYMVASFIFRTIQKKSITEESIKGLSVKYDLWKEWVIG